MDVEREPTEIFVGTRCQAYYKNMTSEGILKIVLKDYPYLSVVGYSMSREGHICVFMKNFLTNACVYKWLPNYYEMKFYEHLRESSGKLSQREKCHFVVFSGNEESYGCDGWRMLGAIPTLDEVIS